MLGRNPGIVTTQGQVLADLFAADGVEVISASSKMNRVWRLADIVASLIASRNKIDVCILEVYSGLYMVVADTASRICKLFGIKLIAVLHGGNLPDFAGRYPKWTRSVLSRADVLVSPSSFLSKEIGLDLPDIRVIPNVIDLERYRFKERNEVSPRLLWMRSFHPIYNPQMALRVLTEVLKSHPDASLVMAGVNKGLEPEIKEMASKLGIRDQVMFPGFLSQEDKVRAFAEADIFINTNRLDNMPVSVIEACAFGLPVVATNVGGISHLFSDGENALLVESDNVEEMAAAIERLLNAPELAEKLSRNGHALAERSSWRSVRRLWTDLFEELAGDRSVGNEPIADTVLS